MADVVKFPGASSDREINDDGDRLHAEAFRDLEPGICDCTTMAKIAAQIVLSANTTDCELVFAVAHVSEMLDAFKANYYAATTGRNGGTQHHEAPASIDQKAQPATAGRSLETVKAVTKGRGLRSRAHTAGADLAPAALTRRG